MEVEVYHHHGLLLDSHMGVAVTLSLHCTQAQDSPVQVQVVGSRMADKA